jgi:hypothetical protein
MSASFTGESFRTAPAWPTIKKEKTNAEKF